MATATSHTGISLLEIARHVQGEVVGDESALVFQLCSLDEQTTDGLGFVKSPSKRVVTETVAAATCKAVLVSKDLAPIDTSTATNIIYVKDPFLALISLVPLFFTPRKVNPGVSPHAVVDPTARLGKGVFIGPFCNVGENVELGDDVVLHSHVVLYPGVRIGHRAVLHAGVTIREDCLIGNDTILQPGAVIGADGFGYVPDPVLGLKPVPQIGITTLADGVEVGANSCIDRATLGSTRVGKATKIDNLVQIGHNTHVGNFTIICGQAAIAGSSKIGNQVVLGGNAGVGDHTEIADGCRFAGLSGAQGIYSEKGDYAGMPAIPAIEWKRGEVVLRELAKSYKELKQFLKNFQDKS